MLRQSIFLSVFVCLLLGFGQRVQASHAMGADLTYTCLGGNNYQFNLSFYRDCDGISAPSTFTMSINSANCGVSTSISLSQVPGTGQEVSPLCPTQIGNSTCSSGSLPGVQQWEYTGTYTLPSNCTDWVFSIREGNRNAAITTMSAPGSEWLYVAATLDNVNSTCNSSPSFTTLPVPYVCTNNPYVYNHGAVDPDGDSLVYSLIDALTNAGTPVAYNVPFSGINPLSSVPPVSIDPSNGNVNMNPNAVEVAVVAVLVEEYRNGVLIGSTIRDIQVTILNCSNNAPTISPISNLSGGVQTGNYSVEVCPGDLVSFDIPGLDSDAADSVFFYWNNGISGGTFTPDSGSSPVTSTFSWTPTGSDIGLNALTVTLEDDACPIKGIQTIAIDINVLAGTFAGPDNGFCPSGTPPQLNATGGSSFTWNVLAGDGTSLSCTNCANPTASPNTTTTYEVVSNLSSTCRNRDTIVVNVVPDFVLNMSSDTTICAGGAIDILAAPGTAGNYNFTWSPTSNLSNPTDSMPTASPPTNTSYTATVTSAGGCVRNGSVNVTVGPPLSVSASSAAANLCSGNSTSLNALVGSSPALCGTNAGGCSGSTNTSTMGTGTLTTGGPTPYEGFWHDGRVQYLYTAAELNALGFNGGTITSLAFDVATLGSTMPYTNFNIRMGCTGLTSLSTFEIGLSLVYSGSHTAALGWNTHTLNTAYDWDGSSNLIVEICFDNTGYSSDDDVRYTATTFTSVVYDYADNDAGCTLNGPLTSSNRANTRFEWCPAAAPGAVTYAWSPSTELNNASISNPTASPTSPTTFTVLVTDVGSNCVTQDQVSIDVDFVDAGTPQAICAGDTAGLNALYSNPAGAPPASCGANPGGCVGPTSSGAVGNSSNTSSSPTPFDGFWEDSRVQYLYTAAELNAMGFTGGTITELGFNVSSKSSTQPFSNLNIRLGCTGLTSLSSFQTGLTTVFTGSHTTVTNWNTFTLATPYDWDGVSNLLLEICWDNASYTGDDAVFYTATSFNSVVYDVTDGASGCSLATPTTSTSRANTRFTFCNGGIAPSYSWTPTGSLDNPNAINPRATPTSSTLYYVTVSDAGCVTTDSVFVDVNCGVLPVDQLELSGQEIGTQSLLRWEAVNELELSHYELMRSASPIGGFEKVSTLAAKNLANASYEYVDPRPESGVNYYRLRVVDQNGTTSLSNTVELNFATFTQLTVAPNPSQGVFGFFLQTEVAGNVDIEIIDLTGKVLEKASLQMPAAGKYQENIDLKDLAKGVYLYSVRAAGQQFYGKLILTE